MANAFQVTVVGIGGQSAFPATKQMILSTLNVTASDGAPTDMTGANTTIEVPSAIPSGSSTRYYVTELIADVLDAINTATTVDLDVVNNLTVEGVATFDNPNVYAAATGISAFATGGQASATQLTKEYNNVTTVATAGDSVKLVDASLGLSQTVKNNGVAALAIFPATGDTINGGSANASVTCPVNATLTFKAISATDWETTTENVDAPTVTTDIITERTAGAGILLAKPIIRKAGTAKAVNITGAITAAELAGGFVTSTSAAAVTATLPTASLLATQLGAAAGTSFEFIVDNSAGSNTVTVAVNTGITVGTTALTGGDSLTISTAQVLGVFRLTFTSTTAAILRRIC